MHCTYTKKMMSQEKDFRHQDFKDLQYFFLYIDVKYRDSNSRLLNLLIYIYFCHLNKSMV